MESVCKGNTVMIPELIRVNAQLAFAYFEVYTESSKRHATHKSVIRENFTIMLVVILIQYVGTTVLPPRATGAGATLTPSCTPSVE
jgi:hypothetical protein